jgi:hypothetical protein
MKTHQTEKSFLIRRKILRPILMVLGIFGLGCSATAFASNTHWLSFDLNTRQNISFDQDPGSRSQRDQVKDYFNDDVNLSVTVTQTIRGMIDPSLNENREPLVGRLLDEKSIGAVDWFLNIPAPILTVSEEKEYFECQLDAAESMVACDDSLQTSVRTGTADNAPKDLVYQRELVAQIFRQSQVDQAQVVNSDQALNDESTSTPITLIPRPEGLLSVEGGEIEFDRTGLSRQIYFDNRVTVSDWSIYVRNPSIVGWDEKDETLTSKKSGATELFVVTPGRISIIPITIGKHKNGVKNAKETAFQVSPGLASLDGLDRAASSSDIAASLSSASTDSTLTDLKIDREVAQLGDANVLATDNLIRAKAKVSFESIRIKLIDERSKLNGAQYPISGAKVKIAGTDFSEMTNSKGELDIRDVPKGSRLLLEISDDRGHIMRQLTEISADRDGFARSVAQLVRIRRFSSLDLIARSTGVVQDMNKASFCGTIHHNGVPPVNLSVALDVYAHGPFYFNHLGLVDLKRSSVGPDGQFCFFNVEPGPVTVSIDGQKGAPPSAALVGLAAGRHSEEVFDLSEARHIATTVTAVTSANEQLGSDIGRANRRDLVDQADLFAVGSGHMMVPIEKGMYTSPTRVLPLKGRVWTVSANQDFEVVVQPITAHKKLAQQMTTFVPNGFISDMAEFANTTHDLSLGSVLVEHGHLSGHGSETVKFRLVDSIGQDVGDGWYFSDSPLTKAIFFNVPPGTYALIVETTDGHLISADTTVVYNEAISIVQTGSPLERRTDSTSQAAVE